MKSVSRKLVASLAAVMVALGASVALAPAAQAAPSSSCPSGATCVWKDHTYKTNGSEYASVWFQQCVSDYNVLNYRGTSTKATAPISVYNNGNYDRVMMYSHTNYWVAGSSASLWFFSLDKKTGDGNVTNDSGYIQNSFAPDSGRFVSVSLNCRN